MFPKFVEIFTRYWCSHQILKSKLLWNGIRYQHKSTTASCQLLARESGLLSVLEDTDNIFTDCDGVLWNGPDVIPGAPEALKKLREMGKSIYFVTNNSTKSRGEYVKKCQAMNIQASEEEIIGTAYVAAQYLKNVMKYTGKVYMLGQQGVSEELDKAGIRHNPPGPDPVHGSVKDWVDMELDPEVKCVLVGFDEHVSYMKLMKAVRYLREVEGCHFIATNTDSVLPMGEGKVVPGTGVTVSAISTGAGRKPDIIMGKPNPPIFQCVQQMHKIDPARTIMIGDRLNTDIMLGHNCGLRTLLVLTGYSSLQDAQKNMSSNSIEHQKQVPHFYIDSLGTLGELLQR